MPPRAVTIVLLVIALVGCQADDAATLTPQPTPALYVTQNHGLRVHMPPGLSYCPLPKDWMGSDHGTMVFLTPPATCAQRAGYPSTARGWSDPVPAISLYYGFNVVEIERPGEDPSPPRTDQEAADHSCKKPYEPLPDGLTLFGKPAIGCAHYRDDAVTIQVIALYAIGERDDDDELSREVSLRLRTTPARLARDLPVVAQVARSIAPCRTEWAKHGTIPRCPDDATWW